MPGGIVPSSAHSDLEFVRACEVEGRHDIARADATSDHRRPAVDESVEAAACRVVLRIPRSDDCAGHRPPQLVQALRDYPALRHPATTVLDEIDPQLRR